MRKYLNYIIVLGIALMAISCAQPEDPTAANMAEGTWFADDVYVSGQVDNSNIIERFVLERDGNFVLEDANGVLSVGTWDATDDAITLTLSEVSGGGSVVLTIVTMTYNKAHLIQNLTGGALGDVEIRYLMNKSNTSQY